MNINIVDELSKLTTINPNIISKLFSKIIWCLSDGVYKAQINNDNTISADLSFGTLKIEVLDDKIKYRFEPSKNLEKSLINTVVNEQNELELVVEKSIVNKLSDRYKDMF